jgi:hypothetical protein
LAAFNERKFKVARQATTEAGKAAATEVLDAFCAKQVKFACFLHLRLRGGDIRKQYGNVISVGPNFFLDVFAWV